MTERMEIRLLGGFDAWVDGRLVSDAEWTHGRATDLVKLLALAPGHRLTRDQVLEALWPQLGADAARANLHKAAHHARRALGASEGVVLRGGLVMLAPAAETTTDVERFEASADPDDYGGELLPDDRYAVWTQERRRALHAAYLEALRAADRWEDVAAEDAADEQAGLAVMRSRFAAGDRLGALRAYERMSVALDKLGLSPGVETVVLHGRISGGAALDRALAAVEVELKTAPVDERAGLLATRADLLMAMADRSAPAAYAEAAAAAGPEGMALRIRQAWAQLAGGDATSAQATLAIVAPGSERERIAHLLAQAAAAWFSGDAEEAGRRAGDAQALAEASGLARETRMAIQIQAMVAHSTGTWSHALGHSVDMSLLAPDLADSLFDGHLCVGEYAVTCGEPLDVVRAQAETLHASAARSGARRAQVFLDTLLGAIALISGRLDEADARLRDAVRLSREIGAVSAEAYASVRLGETSRARGELAEGNKLLADAIVISRWSPMSNHLIPLGYAALLRATDDRALGLERLEDATAQIRHQEIVCAYCGMTFGVAAAVAAARAGRPDLAEDYLAAAEGTIDLWPGGPWPAAIEEARGEVALARGDQADAVARLQVARDGFAQQGRKFEADRVSATLTALT